MKCNVFLLVVAAGICTAIETIDFEGFKRCSIIGEEARCSLGIRQAQLDHAVDCGNFPYATYFSRICSVNSNGHTCGLAGAYHPEFLQLLSTCVGVTDCSTECRNLMMMLREELGCCINAVYNYTGSFFEPMLAPAFNYSLWSACGVEPVSDTCTGNIPFTLPADSVSTCNLNTIQTRILSEWCEPTPFNRLRAVLNESVGCEVFIDFQTDVCSLNANGEYCSSTTDHFNYLQAIQNHCNFSSDSCSPECRNYFEGIATDHGCCVNANFNSTFATVHGQNFEIIREEAKWIQCGIRTPPTDCELPGKSLNLQGSIYILTLSILMIFLGTN